MSEHKLQLCLLGNLGSVSDLSGKRDESDGREASALFERVPSRLCCHQLMCLSGLYLFFTFIILAVTMLLKGARVFLFREDEYLPFD